MRSMMYGRLLPQADISGWMCAAEFTWNFVIENTTDSSLQNLLVKAEI